ncbi:MAG: SH3 domain-containing protein [Paludibacteraceae bacterium]|nr:SH3 domain-containing protein [Paludibacteraceae bacterium]MBP5136370.1 SH3 domain-containing protein [Paludibacteraceae bacterium]MBP5742967.1 SH3 domain-containing protein [Paludibacteraceae bacterium]
MKKKSISIFSKIMLALGFFIAVGATTEALAQSKVVVISGTGVRLRLGPGTDYNYLTNDKGDQISPSKGAKLEYQGEYGDWYRVKFSNGSYYVSKDFAYIQNGAAKPAAKPAKKVVVISGTGVRLRLGPGTDYTYLKNSKGEQISPAKGAKLDYIGEEDGWFIVKYGNGNYYVSKDFSYISTSK